MAESADRVIVELEARLGRYNANIAGAERHFDRSMRNIQGAAGRTEARVASAFRNMATAAGVTIGTAGVILAAREFLRYADAAKNVEAQLRLATRQSGSFAQAQEDVRRIASQTRSGLEETATLYAVFQRNARELGITQLQAARATQTVSETFLISGASAAEAAGGLRQFLQGIQSGVIRGEELNSVLENAPRLARLLADSLSVTVGQLRAMGQEGELTADKLITALTNRRFTDQIDAEFRELPVTFEQAMTLVNNAAIVTFGAFDRGGQFSTALANFITQGTDGMADLEDAAEQTGISVRAAFEGLGDAFLPLVDGAFSAFDAIGIRALDLRRDIAGLLGEIDALFNMGRGAFDNAASGAYAAFGGGLSDTVMRRRMGVPLPGAGPAGRANMRGRFESGYDRAARRGQGAATQRRVDNITNAQGFQRYLNEPGRYNLFGVNMRPGPPPRPTSSGGRKRRRRGEDPEAVARREAADEQRFQNELASLNEDLLAARQSMVTAADAIAAFEVQQIEAARDRQNAAYQAEVAQTRGSQEVAQARATQLIEANNAAAAERVRAVALREQQRIDEERVRLASSDLDNAIELEQAQGALAVTTDERRASALRLLDLQEQEERLQLEGIVALRGLNDARGREAQNRLNMLDSLYQARRQGVTNDNLSPRDRYLRDLSNAGAAMNESLDEVAISGFQRLNDELAQSIAGFFKLGGVAGSVLNEILTGLLRIAIQQQIIRPLAEAMFGGGGAGGGGGFGAILSSIAGAFGGGGIAPGNTQWTQLANLGGTFAPGMASGGSFMVGGRGGVDRNLLSINGQPRAMVSGDERIAVIPQGKALASVGGHAASPGGGGRSGPVFNIQIDAKDAVLAETVKGWVIEGVQAATELSTGYTDKTVRAIYRPRLNRG